MGGLARHLLVAGVGAALALGASPASAGTFCVNGPAGCAGTAESTIGAAITAAAGSPGRDTIQIAGSHTYDETGLNVAPGNAVDIVGVGTPQPVITDTSTSATRLLNVQDATSNVTNVGFLIPAAVTSDTGLVMSGGAASGINVDGSAAGAATEGVSLTGGTLSNANVTVPRGISVNSTVALGLGGLNPVVQDSTFTGTTAIQVGGGTGARVSRVTAIAPEAIDENGGNHAIIEDTLIRVAGETGFEDFAIAVTPIDTNPVDLTVRNVTAVDEGGHGSDPGVVGVRSSTSGGVPTITIRDSIVRGFPDGDLVTGETGVIDSDYNDWGTPVARDGATAPARGAHDLNVDPGFVNAAGEDFHLAAGSPMIDAGEPGGLLIGDSATDLYGADRLAAVATPCSYIRDVGAAEFQPGLPVARASGPATGVTGNQLAFSATGSCGPSIGVGIASFAWSFDDGGSGSGPTVSHAFSKPGSHTAKLTVTDSQGHAAAAAVSVNVIARRASMSRLRLSPAAFRAGPRGPSASARRKTGTRVSYRLNEAARVRFVVKQRRAHRRKLKALRGSFTVRGKAGSNRFHFSGRLRHRKLRPGRYVLVGTPGSGAVKGRAVSVRFRIVR